MRSAGAAPTTGLTEPLCPSGPALLRLSGVCAGYGNVEVLREVDLEVPAASVVSLLGANGAGKTTLLRVASGLLKPNCGTVSLFGADVTAHKPYQRANVGLCHIPEGRGIFPALSVRENLELSVPLRTRAVDLERALAAFPILAGRMRQVAGSMSGGEQQMLALARAYLCDPRIVLLDEVSMGLAPIVVDQIFESIRHLADLGISLLIVEQYLSRALELSNYVYLIDHGRITFAGRPESLDEGSILHSYLGVDSGGEGKEP